MVSQAVVQSLSFPALWTVPFSCSPSLGRQPLPLFSFPPEVLVSGITISFFCSVRPRGGKNFVALLISVLPHPFSFSALPSLG